MLSVWVYPTNFGFNLSTVIAWFAREHRSSFEKANRNEVWSWAGLQRGSPAGPAVCGYLAATSSSSLSCCCSSSASVMCRRVNSHPCTLWMVKVLTSGRARDSILKIKAIKPKSAKLWCEMFTKPRAMSPENVWMPRQRRTVHWLAVSWRAGWCTVKVDVAELDIIKIIKLELFCINCIQIITIINCKKNILILQSF